MTILAGLTLNASPPRFTRRNLSLNASAVPINVPEASISPGEALINVPQASTATEPLIFLVSAAIAPWVQARQPRDQG